MSITAIFRSKLEVANGSPDGETKWVLSAMVRDLRKVEAVSYPFSALSINQHGADEKAIQGKRQVE